MNYKSNGYHVTVGWSCYFDFAPQTEPLPFHYQVESSTGSLIYNGTEKFELKESSKTISINDHPERKDFEGLSFLYNSIITLKNALPILIRDENTVKTASDTILNNQPMRLVTLNIGKRRIQNLGDDFDIMQTPYNLIYQIIIDPTTFLPVQVIQSNDSDNDFIKTSFSNLTVDPVLPEPNTWFYSTYSRDYEPEEEKDIPDPLQAGVPAPEWSLQYYDNSDNLSHSDLNGKVVLLEFWIKNCSYCITSVPHLNRLKETFKGKEVAVISLNVYDSENEIEQFVELHNISYPVLKNARPVAEEFGVYAYPALFIIDKSGTIIHADGSLSESNIPEIEKMVREAL